MKSSDAELYQHARTAANQHGASFIGPADAYKYGMFQLADGRTIELHLYHVRDGKWPKDVDKFLERQEIGRGRSQEKMLTRLKALAQDGEATLLDQSWAGPHAWYSFELADGRIVKIRGSKLVTSGWPKDIDAYLEWSAARRQEHAEPKGKSQLFDEFRAIVESNNAVVLSPEWLGARIPHEVLLSDGTIRRLKPNQLKYFGWPAVPFDELRKMAAPYPVHILPDTADKETQVFRISVSGGVYLEGPFADLKALWAEGAPAVISDTCVWAELNGMKMVPAKWQGILAEYEFTTPDGPSVWRKVPAADAHEQQRQNDAEVAKLRRVGTLNGAKLLAQPFAGKDAVYAWEKDGQVIMATTQELIERSRQHAFFNTLKGRVKELGLVADLVSTEWEGMCSAYQWRLADGSEITAKLSQLRTLAREKGLEAAAATKVARARTDEARVLDAGAGDQSLAVLRSWGDEFGIKLLSTDWVDASANYEWALPDGTIVAASLKKVRNCTRAVLRQRGYSGFDMPGDVASVIREDCHRLRDRISTSKSR